MAMRGVASRWTETKQTEPTKPTKKMFKKLKNLRKKLRNFRPVGLHLKTDVEKYGMHVIGRWPRNEIVAKRRFFTFL